jgi:DNA polymerase-1
MRIVSFDFETKDPFIGRKMGAGWVYAANNYQDCDFFTLGMAWSDGIESGYTVHSEEMRNILSSADYLVAQNAAYDLGCLQTLGMGDIVNKFYGKTICTVMAAKLIDSSRMSYSLDNLAKSLLGEKKLGHTMALECWDKHIFPLTKIEEKKGRGECPDNKLSRLKNWVMSNLDIVQEADYELVARYAITDAILCYNLLQKLIKDGKKYYDNPLDTFCYWSKLIHVTQDYTMRGLRVDLEKADQATQYLQPKITDGMNKIYDIVGYEFNLNSSKQLPSIFQELGLKTATSATGQPSVTKEILEAEKHPVAQLIRDTKQYLNIKNNFIDKMIKMQRYTMKEGEDETRRYGRVHPHYSPLAAKTGRFSCNGPNLQQIPKRNKELGQWCRGIFVPEEGKKWYSLDFSNQEGRLQIHYSSLTKCKNSDIIINKFAEDANYDLHSEVAEMVSVSRSNAKTINLGLSYGMGEGKLCHSLNLPTKRIQKYGKVLEVAGDEGKAVLERYHQLYPFLKQLIERATNAATANGYIRTIGKRAVTNDKAYIDGKLVKFTHKAFNQLIQGSAFDQTGICMIKAYEEDIPVNLTVHDELDFSGTEEEAARLKEIMETTLNLLVPSVTDVGVGDDWWEACQ